MKLTENLQNKLNNATAEEAKAILAETKQNVEDAGIVLEDSELDEVAGGARTLPPDLGQPFLTKNH